MTFRAVAIGLLASCGLIALVQAISITQATIDVGGGAPPPMQTGLLFLYMLLAPPLLQRLRPAWALQRSELLVVYLMLLLVGPMAHPHSIGFLIPHAIAPAFYPEQEPRWQQFLPALPPWFGPTDPALGRTFFQRGGAVPWGAWLAPMFAWTSFLVALYGVMLCLNAVVRRAWIEQERLTFPLVALPLALAGGGDEGPLRRPLFWAGFLVVLGLQAPHGVHTLMPSFPDVQLRDIVLLDAGPTLPPPWSGLGTIYISFVFWLIGVAYLLPKEITLSAVLFYLVTVAENVAAVFFGYSEGPPNVYSNDFPALYSQGAGAAYALGAIALWNVREPLRRLFISWRSHRGGDRLAALGLILGSAYLLGWLWLAGMRLWAAAAFLVLLVGYFFIFARIRAETGLGMGAILWPQMLDSVVITAIGARNLQLSELTVLYSFRWLYFGMATGSVMACQLEGFKLGDAAGLSRRQVALLLAVTAAVTVPAVFAWTLRTYYHSAGFFSLPIGHASMVSSQVYWSYMNLLAAHSEAKGPDGSGVGAMGFGALFVGGLSWLRMRFMGMPLHPVGYVAANAWGMHLSWLSFLLGWLANAAVMRYAGLGLYRRLIPLFFGGIVADLLQQLFWGVVLWRAGGMS